MVKVYIFCGVHPHMPELPEVETVVRQLRPLIIGKRIVSVQNLDRTVLDRNIQNAVSQQERCPKNHPVSYDKVGGRGTYYCMKCQR